MLPVFIATLNPMLVMFMCMLIGYILNRKKLLAENSATILSRLETLVLVPALSLTTFMNNCTAESLSKNATLLIFSVGILFAAIAIGCLTSRFFVPEGYQRNIYRYALTFGNSAFMGNAIVPMILGQEALYYYMLFTLPISIAIYTWGMVMLAPRNDGKSNPLLNLLNPVVIATAIGMFLGLTGLSKYVPEFVTTTAGNLGACMGPVAMLLTGFIIGNYDLKKLLTDKKVYIATVLRLFIFPAILIALTWLCGGTKEIARFVLFGYATPLGINTVVFPAAYGHDTSTGASMATISHVCSVITLPIMFTLLEILL